jgi:hypothetical protein
VISIVPRRRRPGPSNAAPLQQEVPTVIQSRTIPSARSSRLRAQLTAGLSDEPPTGVRLARRRDALRIAAVFARSLERPRRHPPRVQTLIPLHPIRLTLFWLTGLLIGLLAEAVLVAGAPSALLVIDQQHPAARARTIARVLGCLALAGIVMVIVDGLATLASLSAAYETLRWTAAVLLAACTLRLIIANRPLRALRAAGRKWAKTAPGPVWWLTGFSSDDPQAAITLGLALCKLADDAAAILMAVAEGTTRLRAYQRAGFTMKSDVRIGEELCALLVRWPRPAATDSALPRSSVGQE